MITRAIYCISNDALALARGDLGLMTSPFMEKRVGRYVLSANKVKGVVKTARYLH